jgi:outer membrane scaffolding protein for murein synthesis (MipA/OmpV family)
MTTTTITLALTAALIATPAATITTREANAQQASGQHGDWQGSVGVVGGSVGSYYGSDARRTLGAPLVGLVYKQRLLIGTTANGGLGGGMEYLVTRGIVRTSLGVSGVERRRENRGDALAGMDDRSGGAYGTASVALRVGPAAAISNTAVGFTREAGIMQTLGLQLGGAVLPRVTVSVAGSATFANRNNMAFDFGITDEQAARRRELIAAGDGRLRDTDGEVFAPEGGFKEMRGTAQLAYAVRGAWRIVGVVSHGRLARDIAESPLARKRDALTAAAGLAYGF